jgi:hypothetical protein
MLTPAPLGNTPVIGFLKKRLKHPRTLPNKLIPFEVARTLDEFDIDAAIASHQNWKYRLFAYLHNESNEDMSPEVICFDDRCDLGRWIHGSGKAHLGAYPGFTALMGHHKMFHYAASSVVALSKAGREAHARKMLAEQFTAYSKAVVHDLERLRRAAVYARKQASKPKPPKALPVEQSVPSTQGQGPGTASTWSYWHEHDPLKK